MPKSREALLQELNTSIRSAGDGRKTSAQDLRTFLTSLVDELLDRTTAPVISTTVPTTGLLAWWRADQGVSHDDAGAITKWADQSGHKRTLFPHPDFAPLTTTAWAGSQAVLFEGQQIFDLLDLGLPAPPSVFTIVMAMQKKTGASGMPASFEYAVNLYAIDGSFVLNTWSGDYTGVAGVERTLDVPVIVATELTSRRIDESRIWFNGQEQAVRPLLNAPGIHALEPIFRLGGNAQLSRGNYFWQGWIGEVLLYDRVLSDDEHAQLTATLSQRYTLG